MDLPLRWTVKPSPAQAGRRRASVSLFGDFRARWSEAESPSGKVVSTSIYLVCPAW